MCMLVDSLRHRTICSPADVLLDVIQMQDLVWNGLDLNIATAAASTAPAGDAFGRLASAGAIAHPMLLPQADAAHDAAATPPFTAAGRILISGGLGGVGSLAAAWLAAMAGSEGPEELLHAGSTSEIVLLGRSGRTGASPLMATLQRSAVAVTMARCDVCCAAEAAQLAAGSGQPLAGIIHAGGVLADAMIPSQTVAGIRRVYAPKVGTLSACSTPV
jgi:KR domain